MRYTFEDSRDRPGYITVYGPPLGEALCELWHDHALMVVPMYNNLLEKDEKRAYDFMWGHLFGITQAQLWADKYPKIEWWFKKGQQASCAIHPAKP